MHAEYEDHNKRPQLGNPQPTTNPRRNNLKLQKKRKSPIEWKMSR